MYSILSSLLLLVTPFFLLVIAIVAKILFTLIQQRLSPLRHLPGPPSPSLFMGNLGEMHDQENTNLVARWEELYGSTFVYRGFLGGCRLMTTDPVAVAHILGNAYDYPKPDFIRTALATMAAGYDGLLTVEGDMHRKQRKILAPAFSSTHIKSLTPIFWAKATQLRDIWLTEIDSSEDAEGHEKGVSRIDVLVWLGRATLDVIGLAGFGYSFNSLTDDTNELANAFGVIFSTARKFRMITILQVWFPFLRRFRRNNTTMIQATNTMRRIGLELIEEKRRAVEEEMHSKIAAEKKANGDQDMGIQGDKTTLGRDLLSVLIRSNRLATSPEQQMSVNEVLCQISTFIAAGHETTASAMTWCLYALARDAMVQKKLRAALLEVEQGVDSPATRGPSFDTCSGDEPHLEHQRHELTNRIMQCEYLDWVVRESLRVHAPVTNTMRVCMREEDHIPVQDGGFADREGRRRCGISVKKGDIISVPIQAINKSETLWGEDAQLFRPERWASPPADIKAIPGLYSNTLTFLNGNPLGGNRACIGYKFALIEIKIFLYVLLKDMQFSIDPSMVIEKRVNVVTRPFVKSEPDSGNQMPLHISRATGSTSLPSVSVPYDLARPPTLAPPHPPRGPCAAPVTHR
ncbi:cytochrome P450 [Crucibulum laeve]|uniref:Cytochrome P450 n=1 Tax=Crucibulum laeve TaxID=68775 RepID=A0A5C3M8E4_9AGAR|nr:cytochrome P450 [Crucibulum laeve]